MVETSLGTKTEQTYKVISELVDEQLQFHKGETFNLDAMCRWLQPNAAMRRESRNLVTIKLAYEVKRGHLEKSNTIYRYINKEILRLNWKESLGAKNLSLNWPIGLDNSKFGFDGRILVPEKGLIVLAGVTNTGKSVFCRNFLFRNMDKYRCVYYTSETSQDDFAEYASKMSWANPTREDGTDKFDLVWREKDFKDILDPNAINIVDWLNIYDNFYKIGEILDGMKAVLDKGLLLVAIQKDPAKGLGVGGMWAQHKSSLYITMDYGRITVEKAKKWHTWNPNKQSSGFDIVDEGTHFCNIRPLKKCGFCWNGKKNNATCTVCQGTGFVEDDAAFDREF